jgi:hypothetical protein
MIPVKQTGDDCWAAATKRQGLFPKISNISNKNMTFCRFSGVFCLALLARIPVGKSLVSGNLQPDTKL